MSKIKVENPVVELDGDEMTRIIWQFIKDRLIHPYLDVDLEYYDLGIEHRDATDDQVTVDAANAIKQHGVGVKCATITPDEARVEEFGLKKMWLLAQRHDPQHPRRRDLPRADHHQQHPAAGAGLDEADHHRPSRPRRPVQGDELQGPRRRHGDDHLHAGRRLRADRARGRPDARRTAASSMGMYNFNKSIEDFARASLLVRAAARLPGLPLDQEHDPQGVRRRVQGHLRRTSSSASSRPTSTPPGLTYEHRLIDDMVAAALKWEGGYVWACKNYDGDVQSDTVAQGFGSLGLMTSVLMTPDGKTVEAEAAHGTVTRHYRQHQQGKPTSTNPIASIFAWTGGLKHRGKLDGTPEVTAFAESARAGLRRDRRERRDDQGPRAARRPGPALAHHRGVPGRPRREPADAPASAPIGAVAPLRFVRSWDEPRQ